MGLILRAEKLVWGQHIPPYQWFYWADYFQEDVRIFDAFVRTFDAAVGIFDAGVGIFDAAVRIFDVACGFFMLPYGLLLFSGSAAYWERPRKFMRPCTNFEHYLHYNLL